MELPSNATKKDTYVASLWGKIDACEKPGSRYGITLSIMYDQGDKVWMTRYFDTYSSQWQYLSFAFSLDDGKENSRRPIGITYFIVYQEELNTGTFDNAQLVKDDVPSYDYDNQGNLVSAKDKEKNEQFSADSAGQITQMTDTKGSYQYYSYDHTGNIVQMRSTTGVQTSLENDSRGNPTTATAQGNPAVSSFDANTLYYVRNKKSGLYIDAFGNSYEGATIQSICGRLP